MPKTCVMPVCLGGCSKHMARHQQSFCSEICCVCVEQCMIYRSVDEWSWSLKPWDQVYVVSQVWRCLAVQKAFISPLPSLTIKIGPFGVHAPQKNESIVYIVLRMHSCIHEQ